MANVEIIAEGSFSKTPCAHVLLYVRDRSLTGTLVVRADEGRHMAYFEQGRLVQVDNPPSDLHGGAMPDRLGEVLVSLGYLTEEALSDGVVGPGMIGERLVALGACNERAVDAALDEQTRRRGARMFECDGVQPYAFYSGNLLRQRTVREPVDTMSVVWRGLSAGDEHPTVAPLIKRFAGQFLQLKATVDVVSLGLDPLAARMLDSLRVAQSVEAIIRRCGDENVGRRLVYLMLLGKLVDVVPPRAATTSTPPPPMAAPAPRSAVVSTPPPAVIAAPRAATVQIAPPPSAPVSAPPPSAPAPTAAPVAVPARAPGRVTGGAPVAVPARAPGRVTGGAPVALSALTDVLGHARKIEASDVHIVAERPLLFRTLGELQPEGEPLAPSTVEAWAHSILPAPLREVLQSAGSCDLAYDDPKVGRFRANVSRQRTGLKICMRVIGETVPSIASLGLPESLAKATHHHQGLIVVTGPTSHGKTCTLNALLELINRTTTHHVITVEDPVEYVHPRVKAMMSQREVGTHTRSFASALKGSLREDPDVIAIGEMRDTETVRMALSASETGHLVIATMNTPSAAKTIDRLIDMFPPADQTQVRTTLAGALRMVVSQRLIARADGRGMAAAVELLPGSIALWSLIRDGKTFQIPSLQQRGKALGIIRLDDSLSQLVKDGIVTMEAARPYVETPEDFDPFGQKKGPGAPGQPAAKANDGLFSRAQSLLGKKG